MNTELFLDELLLPQWFCCVGQGKIIKEPTGEVIKVSESLDDAISVWENDFENRCDAWEELRLKLLSNQTWENDFHILRNNTWDILKNNIFFVNFAKEVKKRTQLDPEFFFSQLPILGRWGEQLLNIEDGFYKKQVSLFREGVFVCNYSVNYWLIF